MAEQEKEHDPVGTPYVTDAIRRSLADFTASERRIARLLLSGPPTVGLESSSRVAEWAHVSGPTVIRFANRLGYPTYGAFQQALRDELNARVLSPVDLFPPNSESSDGRLISRTREVLVDALTSTLENTLDTEFERATALLADRKNTILTFGGWFSGFLALHLAGLLQEVRPKVRYVSSAPKGRAVSAVDVSGRHVAVVFDFRRYEPETELLAREMHDRKGSIILFTDRLLSPVVDVADVVLAADIGDPLPFETFLPTLALVELLTANVIATDTDAARERLDTFRKVVNQFVPGWTPTSPLDSESR